MMAALTIEFLVIFLLTFALMSAICHEALSGAGWDGFEAAKKTNRAEAAARAIESMLNCGTAMRFDFQGEGVRYSIREGRFNAEYKGKIIEVNGVYENDRSEPL